MGNKVTKTTEEVNLNCWPLPLQRGKTEDVSYAIEGSTLLAAAVDAFQFATLPVLAHETTGTNRQGHVMERCARNAVVLRPAHSLSSSETVLWA